MSPPEVSERTLSDLDWLAMADTTKGHGIFAPPSRLQGRKAVVSDWGGRTGSRPAGMGLAGGADVQEWPTADRGLTPSLVPIRPRAATLTCLLESVTEGVDLKVTAMSEAAPSSPSTRTS